MAVIEKRDTEAIITLQLDKELCVGHIKLRDQRLIISMLKPKSWLTLTMGMKVKTDSFNNLVPLASEFIMHRAMAELSKLYFTSKALTLAKPAVVGCLLGMLKQNPLMTWSDARIEQEIAALPEERRDLTRHELEASKADLLDAAKTQIRAMFTSSEFEISERSLTYLVSEIFVELGVKI